MKPVMIAGPHRSGTSVTTRVVSLLGPALCADSDRMARWDNPAGHWESHSLTGINDELLSQLKGIWFAPPDLPPDWHRSGDLEALRRRAVEQFRRVHPASGWVWKDPRLCLLLPFWTAALEVDPVIVLTVRDPLACSRSLMARDAWGVAHALAIWERYAAAQLANCRERPVVVVRYERLLEDTYAEVVRLRDGLDALGVDVGRGDVDAAVRAVDGRLRHQRDSAQSLLDGSQTELHQLLSKLAHRYDSFPRLELPAPSVSTTELIAAQRRISRLQKGFGGRPAWIRQPARSPNAAAAPVLELISCRTRAELVDLQRSALFHHRHVLEILIARQHQGLSEFALPGICLADGEAVHFDLDWLYAPPPIEVDWLSPQGEREEIRIPNWRERMLCPKCGMNNRQRAISAAILDAVRRRSAEKSRAPRLYLTEQVTPMFRYFDGSGLADCTGSEYLDPEVAGGTVRDGLRHENVEALSLADASMDLVVSCSVLEHVNEPLDAIREMARILRPGGELFLEFPFDTAKEKSTRRARITGGEVEHLLPPEYHGNPLSSEGSLVFMDFGWDFVGQIEATGLLTCEMKVYWSLEHGHLGGTQFFFHARRTDEPVAS